MAHTREDEERLFKKIEEGSRRKTDKKFNRLMEGGIMSKINTKLEELILKALEENKIEEASKLIELRLTMSRVRSFEGE